MKLKEIFKRAILPVLTGSITNEKGDKWWYRWGKLHRDGAPAVEFADGATLWYQHDKIHRDGGPALETKTSRVWYYRGKVHRPDGPSVILADGTQMHFEGDKLHNYYGPAIERPDGTKEWFVNGKRDRIPWGREAPAIEHADGSHSYYHKGAFLRTDPAPDPAPVAAPVPRSPRLVKLRAKSFDL